MKIYFQKTNLLSIFLQNQDFLKIHFKVCNTSYKILNAKSCFTSDSIICLVSLRAERDYLLSQKAFDCVDHNKLWKILKEMRIPDHLTCLLRNLYAGQEATVRTGHRTIDWFQIGKGVHQGCVLSHCYLTDMQNTS